MGNELLHLLHTETYPYVSMKVKDTRRPQKKQQIKDGYVTATFT